MQFAGKTFSLDTAKKLLKVFDTDLSGTIGFFEYASLHQFITSMQSAYYMFDQDGNGHLEQKEVAQALQHAGFQLSMTVRITFFFFFFFLNSLCSLLAPRQWTIFTRSSKQKTRRLPD